MAAKPENGKPATSTVEESLESGSNMEVDSANNESTTSMSEERPTFGGKHPQLRPAGQQSQLHTAVDEENGKAITISSPSPTSQSNILVNPAYGNAISISSRSEESLTALEIMFRKTNEPNTPVTEAVFEREYKLEYTWQFRNGAKGYFASVAAGNDPIPLVLWNKYWKDEPFPGTMPPPPGEGEHQTESEREQLLWEARLFVDDMYGYRRNGKDGLKALENAKSTSETDFTTKADAKVKRLLRPDGRPCCGKNCGRH